MNRFLPGIDDVFTRRVLMASLGVHLFAAFFSTGYHHYDEHYQILEWAGAKLGLTPIDSLAWEYDARIRPWLQPFLVYGVSRLAQLLGIFDPFCVAGFFRLLSAMLGWWATVKLVECSRFWFPDARVRKFAVFWGSLAWFLPYLHARFSSENWSGIFFILGFIPIVQLVNAGKSAAASASASASASATQGAAASLRGQWKTVFVSGLLWGAAFQFRYHAGFLILPAVVWMLLFLRPSLKLVVALAGGFAAFSFLAALIDSWGYGEWTFTAWNYFRVNVLEGKANEWGTAPFWFYFTRFLQLAPPLSTFLVAGTVAGWLFARRFSWTWVTATFVLAHSLVAHKELRFLFPIVALTPFLTAMALQKSSFLHRFFIERSMRWSSAAAVSMNFLFMVPLIVLPTRTEISALKAIWRANPTTLYVLGKNPYSVPGVEAFFYRPAGMEVKMLEPPGEPPGDSFEGFVVCSYPESCESLHAQRACKDFGGSMPLWLEDRVSAGLRARARILDWRLLDCAPAK